MSVIPKVKKNIVQNYKFKELIDVKMYLVLTAEGKGRNCKYTQSTHNFIIA